jgi:hypothetical protein
MSSWLNDVAPFESVHVPFAWEGRPRCRRRTGSPSPFWRMGSRQRWPCPWRCSPRPSLSRDRQSPWWGGCMGSLSWKDTRHPGVDEKHFYLYTVIRNKLVRLLLLIFRACLGVKGRVLPTWSRLLSLILFKFFLQSIFWIDQTHFLQFKTELCKLLESLSKHYFQFTKLLYLSQSTD